MNKGKGRKKGKHNVLTMEKGKSLNRIIFLDLYLINEKQRRNNQKVPSNQYSTIKPNQGNFNFLY